MFPFAPVCLEHFKLFGMLFILWLILPMIISCIIFKAKDNNMGISAVDISFFSRDTFLKNWDFIP